jgi:hypothetical protein
MLRLYRAGYFGAYYNAVQSLTRQMEDNPNREVIFHRGDLPEGMDNFESFVIGDNPDDLYNRWMVDCYGCSGLVVKP